MAKEISQQGLSVFEQIKHTDENGNEFWMARQLAKALDYIDFRNFLGVIEKAKEVCTNSGQAVSNHLVEFNEVVAVGSLQLPQAVKEEVKYSYSLRSLQEQFGRQLKIIF